MTNIFMLRGSLLLIALAGGAAFAQSSSQCGDPPRVDDEQLKGQIAGRAKLLSGYVGGAELTGNIDLARKDIFSKSSEGLKSRADAYLQFQVCQLVMTDKQLSTKEKIDELLRVRQSFDRPIAPTEQSMAGGVTPDITGSDLLVTEFLDINGKREHTAQFLIAKDCQLEVHMPEGVGFKVALGIHTDRGTKVMSSLMGAQSRVQRVDLSAGTYRLIMRATRDAGKYTAKVKAHCAA